MQVARRAPLLIAVAATAAALVPPLLADTRPLPQQPFPDAYEYADAARQIADGEGYVTFIHGTEPQPPRYPPGYSLALTPFAFLGDYPGNVEFGVRMLALAYVLIAVVAAWAIAGPWAAAVCALLIGVSPFARDSAELVLSDAFGAALAVAPMIFLRRVRAGGPLAGGLAGLGGTVRVAAAVNALAAIVAARGARVRVALFAAVPLVGLALFQWATLGSPFNTGYGYWLPYSGGTGGAGGTFDTDYATQVPRNAEGPWLFPDRLDGELLSWACPCPVGGAQAGLPNIAFYPAVLLGLFWVFTPPLATLPGLYYAWVKRRDPVVTYALLVTAGALLTFMFFPGQGVRYVAGAATALTVLSAAAIARAGEAAVPLLRSRAAQTRARAPSA